MRLSFLVLSTHSSVDKIGHNLDLSTAKRFVTKLLSASPAVRGLLNTDFNLAQVTDLLELKRVAHRFVRPLLPRLI